MSEPSPQPKRRSGGRNARVAERTAPVSAFSPCSPGQLGGRYQPLTPTELQSIINAAFDILDDLGMGEAPPILQTQACAKGARINDLGRLCFPRAMVEHIIDQACKSFTFHGRDPAHDIEIGGDRVYFGTGGAAVQTQDRTTGLYRPSTLQDLSDFTRLVDRLSNVSWFTRCCIATDIPDNFDLDLNTVYTLLKRTKKPVGTAFTLASHIDPIMTMVDMVLSGAGEPPFKERPFLKAHISPVISPLRFGEDAVDVTLGCIKHGIPINAIIAAQSGATAPATLSGFLAQTTAETLAALVLVNIFAPGYKMIFSNWPLVIDLRTGAFSGGGGEISILNAASAQISNALGLISGAASSMTDAKAVDAQMGAEKAMSAAAAGLAGANMIYESSGMMGSLLGASFEAFVADDEMLSHIHRMIRGIEVDPTLIGIDAIRAVITGEGHFLGSPHTMDAMQRDYFYPDLADRNPPTLWSETGAPTLAETAGQRADEILNTPAPDYIDAATDRAIRDQFKILL